MERMNWVTRKTPDKSTVHRAPVATWAPERTESLGRIIEDQTPQRVRRDIVQELWERRGDRQTLGGFIKEIKTEEGLTEPK
mgnify:CR=1 FL=1